MKNLLAAILFLFSVCAFGQSQGVSQRATNGISYGEMLVTGHINATNTSQTNTFAGKFRQGTGVAAGTGSAAFGNASSSIGSYAFSAGSRNSSIGVASASFGQSNTVSSAAPSSFAAGQGIYLSNPVEIGLGTNVFLDGYNSIGIGRDQLIESGNDNILLLGQNINVSASTASNTIVLNAGPSAYNISSPISNSIVLNAPGGVYINGSPSGDASSVAASNVYSGGIISDSAFISGTTNSSSGWLVGTVGGLRFQTRNGVALTNLSVPFLTNAIAFQNGNLQYPLIVQGPAGLRINDTNGVQTALIDGTTGTFTGNGSGLTNLNGTNIQVGTINSNKLDAATLALLGGSSASSGPFTNLYVYGSNSTALNNALTLKAKTNITILPPTGDGNRPFTIEFNPGGAQSSPRSNTLFSMGFNVANDTSDYSFEPIHVEPFWLWSGTNAQLEYYSTFRMPGVGQPTWRPGLGWNVKLYGTSASNIDVHISGDSFGIQSKDAVTEWAAFDANGLHMYTPLKMHNKDVVFYDSGGVDRIYQRVNSDNSLTYLGRDATGYFTFLTFSNDTTRTIRFDFPVRFNSNVTAYAVTATNGIFGASGTLSVTTQIVVSVVSGTYTNILFGTANYTKVFGGVTASTDGALTNAVAGNYLIQIGTSFSGAGGTTLYEGAVFTNGVECTIVEWERDVSSATTGNANAMSIVTLPANCRVDFRVKNGGSESATFKRAYLNLLGAN